MIYVPTEQQHADALTKGLGLEAFVRHRDALMKLFRSVRVDFYSFISSISMSLGAGNVGCSNGDWISFPYFSLQPVRR